MVAVGSPWKLPLVSASISTLSICGTRRRSLYRNGVYSLPATSYGPDRNRAYSASIETVRPRVRRTRPASARFWRSNRSITPRHAALRWQAAARDLSQDDCWQDTLHRDHSIRTKVSPCHRADGRGHRYSPSPSRTNAGQASNTPRPRRALPYRSRRACWRCRCLSRSAARCPDACRFAS